MIYSAEAYYANWRERQIRVQESSRDAVLYLAEIYSNFADAELPSNPKERHKPRQQRRPSLDDAIDIVKAHVRRQGMIRMLFMIVRGGTALFGGVATAVSSAFGMVMRVVSSVASSLFAVAIRLLANPYALAAVAVASVGFGLWWYFTKDDKEKRSILPAFDFGADGESPTETKTVPRPQDGINSAPSNLPEGSPPPKIPKGSKGGYTNAIRRNASLMDSLCIAAEKVGLEPEILFSFARAESAYGARQSGADSTAKGPMQIIDSTWRYHYPDFNKKYGIPQNDPRDPLSAAIFSAAYIKDVLMPVAKKIVQKPATADLYALYVFGPGGGRSLLRAYYNNPNDLAYLKVGEGAVRSNPNLFYADGKQRHIPYTLAQTYGLLQTKTTITEMERVAIGETVSVKRKDEEEMPQQMSNNNGTNNPVPDAQTPEFFKKDGRIFRK